MTGGAFKNNSNLLGRRREIEELERSVGILRKELEETQKSIGENRSRRNVLRDTIADFQQAKFRTAIGRLIVNRKNSAIRQVRSDRIIAALPENWRIRRRTKRNWKPLLRPNRKN